MIRLVPGGEKSGKSAAARGMFLDAPGQGVVLAMGRVADSARLMAAGQRLKIK